MTPSRLVRQIVKDEGIAQPNGGSTVVAAVRTVLGQARCSALFVFASKGFTSCSWRSDGLEAAYDPAEQFVEQYGVTASSPRKLLTNFDCRSTIPKSRFPLAPNTRIFAQLARELPASFAIYLPAIFL